MKEELEEKLKKAEEEKRISNEKLAELRRKKEQLEFDIKLETENHASLNSLCTKIELQILQQKRLQSCS